MKSISVFALVLLFFSCSTVDHDDPCMDSDINTSQLEVENGCSDISIDLTETFTIIRNQTDFAQFVTANCQSAVDFDTYDLVIGRKALTNGVASIEYELTEFCETTNQTLEVIITLNETTEAPNITYHALIPKLGANQELMVELTIN